MPTSCSIIPGDNAAILPMLPAAFARLIYIDPPFNTKKVQKRDRMRVTRVRKGDTGNHRRGFGDNEYSVEKIVSSSYEDSFEDYEAFLMPRIKAALRCLTPDGSLFVHLDWHEVHYIKVALDKMLGRDHFMNEIIWSYDYGGRSKSKWSAKHDNILWYVADPKNYVFNYDEIDRIPYLAPGLVGAEKAERGKTPTDCYDRETEVLTSSGWKFWDKITLADELATVSPTFELQFAAPTQLIERHHQGKMVKIKSGTLDLLVTPEHRMWFRRKHSSEYEFGEAKDLADTFYQYMSVRNHFEWVGREVLEDETFFLPAPPKKATGRQAHPFGPVKLGDWCEFVGWWLSEGSTSITKNKTEVTIAQMKPENREKIRKLLTRMNLQFWETETRFAFSSLVLGNYLAKFGKQPVRTAPRELLELPRAYLERLRDGLVGGDGHLGEISVRGNREVSYFSTSKALADFAGEMFLRLGNSYTISKTEPDSKTHWHDGREIIARHAKFSVYRRIARESTIWRERHVSYVDYDGPVYCATVEPHHTLIVRRNGHMAVSGNCWWNTIVPTNGKEKTGYPTQKPLGIMNRIIAVHSKPGDTILDFFAGSGSTGEAAIVNGRGCVLIDSHPEAIRVMENRLFPIAKKLGFYNSDSFTVARHLKNQGKKK
jgi:DNA modification methylase